VPHHRSGTDPPLSAGSIQAFRGEDVGVHPEEAGRLVSAAAAGDAAAWKELVESFSGLVWSVTRGYRLNAADAADVFQTVWLRLAEHVGRIRSPDQVGTWLATTARHESLRVARASTRVILTDSPDLLDSGRSDEHSPEQAFLDSEQAALNVDRAAQLWRALGRLSARCQQLLRVLTASPPPSYAEVAAALGMPVGSIGPTRARCLDRLRRELAGQVSRTS
jgi:RNA polymerase sigma factor (sigma-70 family)